MTPEDFSKVLVRSARNLDVPASGAKARALGHLAASAAGAAGAVGAGATVASMAASGAARSRLAVLAWSLAGAAAVAAGVGGLVLARAPREAAHVVSEPPRLPVVTSPTPPSAEPPSRAAAPAVPAGDAVPAASADACAALTLPDGPPKTCSQRGKAVPFDLRNGCAGDVDVFWVDYDCHEVFHRRMANGDSWVQVTQDKHVWRVRDHATHALLKEYSVPRLPGAPDLGHDGPPRALADVVLRATDPVIADEPAPASCSGAGAASKFTLKNERDEQVVIMWVGLDCKEKYWERLEPKHSRVVNGRDADAWRIRDARTGKLLLDIAPEVPDTTTYLTVP